MLLMLLQRARGSQDVCVRGQDGIDGIGRRPYSSRNREQLRTDRARVRREGRNRALCTWTTADVSKSLMYACHPSPAAASVDEKLSRRETQRASVELPRKKNIEASVIHDKPLRGGEFHAIGILN